MADGFAPRGDQTVFYAGYRMQRNGWVGWEDKKYHLDENGFVQKGCWFEDETGRYFLATKDGHALREDVTIEGQDYYFDENAVMQRGLVTRPDGNVYYYDPATGALQRNVTVNVDGTDYTVDGNGIAAVCGAAIYKKCYCGSGGQRTGRDGFRSRGRRGGGSGSVGAA